MGIRVWLLIAVVVGLPLYELADYTEVWAGDEHFVLPAIVLLLIGMALAGGKRLVNTIITVIASLSRIRERLTLLPYPRSFASNHSTGPPQANLIHRLCDLRL
jgi:hypothetical protein